VLKLDPHNSEAADKSASLMVLHYGRPAKRLAAHVDPEFPSAWRSEPYYRQLKA
jgi:hypothetical protein